MLGFSGGLPFLPANTAAQEAIRWFVCLPCRLQLTHQIVEKEMARRGGLVSELKMSDALKDKVRGCLLCTPGPACSCARLCGGLGGEEA